MSAALTQYDWRQITAAGEMFARGLDTRDIARALMVTEAEALWLVTAERDARLNQRTEYRGRR